MKYIIMCGGNYKDKFKIPKPLLLVNNEILVERTIRLLKENGINDIAISTNNPQYEYLGIELLHHNNEYTHNDPDRNKKSKNSWLNAYYPTNEPACYLPGDVYYSENAIKTIINTKVEDTMFFCIRDISDGRPVGINIKGREPLAYKVENQELFRKAINDLFRMIDNGMFESDPISWNLYRKINGYKLDYKGYGNNIFSTNGDYMYIDDYTTDIDSEKDIKKLEELIKFLEGGIKMIKVEVKERFNFGKFNEIKNLKRKSIDEKGTLFVGDIFECTEEMADYLTGKNAYGRSFVKVIEVIPNKAEIVEEIVEQPVIEEKPKRSRRKKALEE